MKILSAVHWCAGLHNATKSSSVMLKIAESKRGNFLMGLVACGMRTGDTNDGISGGEIASGYLVEELAKWFESYYLLIMMQNKSLYWIKRKLILALKSIHEDLAHYYEKRGRRLGVSYILYVIWGGKYIILQLGEVEMFKFGRFIGCWCVMKSKANVERKGWFGEKRDVVLGEGGSVVWGEGGVGDVAIGEEENAFGKRDFIMPKVKYGNVRKGEGILLCNGKFTKQLSKKKLREALKPTELRSEMQIRKRLNGIADYVGRKVGDGECVAVYIKC